MSSNGIVTLADIARNLNATPQAVSNWKARDQVPYHVVLKLKSESSKKNTSDENNYYQTKPYSILNENVSFSDILLTLAEQIKVIALSVFIAVFIGFTYAQFVKVPLYMSSAKNPSPR